MTQIQLIDLCSRVPYRPKGHVVNSCNGAECDEWLTCATFPMFTSITNNSRLYLRSMSSMTEEERKEVENLIKENRPSPYGIINNKGIDNLLFSVSVTSGVLTNWLNAHHFDYRGLIEKGLAIEVTEENNPY